MGDPGRGTEAALFWHFLLVGLLFVTGGIRRMARAGSRRPFQVAVSVAGVPVVIPALGRLNPVLFTWYGGAFHVRAEYIGVAHVWQFVASAYVLVISVALTLFFLACWGYAQPLFRNRTLRLFLPVVALTATTTLIRFRRGGRAGSRLTTSASILGTRAPCGRGGSCRRDSA